jgi:WD40 repeat protein
MRRFAPAIAIAVASIGCGGCDPSSADGCLRTLKGHTNYVCSVAFDPAGKQIVSGAADGKIKFWDVETGQCRRTLDGHAEWVHSVAVSPDGKFLASGGRDKLVKLWDFESGKLLKTFAGHEGIVKSVAYSPGGRLLASTGGDKGIKIWDVASGDCLKTLGSDDFFSSSMVEFSPDGAQILFAGDSLQSWDVDTGRRVRTFEGHSDSVHAIATSRDGSRIASGGGYTDHSFRLWDAKSGRSLWIKEFTEQEGSVWALAFISGDSVIVSGHGFGAIRYWDVESGECLRTVKAHGNTVSTITADPTGRYLASGAWDNCIKLWKVPSSEPAGQ